ASKNQDNGGREYGRKIVPVESPTENALIAHDGIRAIKPRKRFLQTMHSWHLPLQEVLQILYLSTSNNNKVDTTASGVSTAHTQGTPVNSTSVDNLSDAVICDFLASQPNSPQLAKEDLEQIGPNDLEEINLHWEMAMLTIRAKR
nr:hypothetical protein [Tanacetum cinerariifolium]